MVRLRLLFDECVSHSLAEIARDLEHDVVLVGDVAPAAPDVEIFSLATREARVLVTEDKGFGQIALRSGAVGKGLILLRIPMWNVALKQARFKYLLNKHARELPGELTVVRPSGVRIRKVSGARKVRERSQSSSATPRR